MTMTTAEAMERAAGSGGRQRSSLGARDRWLLIGCVAAVVGIAVAAALISREQDDASPVPSSYGTGSHGAAAAYMALERAGYREERWDRPLGDLAGESDGHTVLILAEPAPGDDAAKRAVAEVLRRGGRVIATGLTGAMLLPESHAEPPERKLSLQAGMRPEALLPVCVAEPEGFGQLTGAGRVEIRPGARWRTDVPEQRVEYMCGDDAVVVSYAAGRGRVVWWADSMPLENASVARDGNLGLLVRSIGPAEGARVVWDESLHGAARGLWSYAEGTPVHLLWAQLALVMVLVVLSFGRRSGPLLPDPELERDRPLEFAESLGALYDRAGATNLAVRAAYDRLCMVAGRGCGRQGAEEIAGVVRMRLGVDDGEIGRVVKECAEAVPDAEQVTARRALELVRTLWEYEEGMKARVRAPREIEGKGSNGGRTDGIG